MPADDFIAESCLRGILEGIIYGLSYFTGACFLALVTLGQISLAPLESLHQPNKNKKYWNDWSIWLHRPGNRKDLRAEAICTVGFLVWIVAGFAIYQIKQSAHSDQTPPPQHQQ